MLFISHSYFLMKYKHDYLLIYQMAVKVVAIDQANLDSISLQLSQRSVHQLNRRLLSNFSAA